MTNYDALHEQIAAEQGRKVTPSEVFKARLVELMSAAQQQADARDEGVLLKAAFLSEEKTDLNARRRMKRIREEMKDNGWKSVSLWLHPNDVALVKARGGSKRLATSLESIINRLAVTPSGNFQPEPEEVEKPAADDMPEGTTVYVGSVVELWILPDGRMDGRLRQGQAARLSALGFGALIGLWHLAQVSLNQDDPAMVERYLDLRFPDWREQGTPEAQATAAVAEPFEVLGLQPTASFEEAKAAYKKAIMAAHPDKGGSRWLFQAVQGAFASIKAAHEEREKEAREAAEQAEREARKAKKAA